MKLGYSDYNAFLTQLLNEVESQFGRNVIISVALFGSVARGEARPESDIDLLIIHKDLPYDPVKRFVKAILALEEKEEYNRLIKRGIYPQPTAIFMSSQELSQKPLILLDILEDGIILKDEGRFLLQKMEALKGKLKEMRSQKIILEDGSWAWDLKPDWHPGELIEIVL